MTVIVSLFIKQFFSINGKPTIKTTDPTMQDVIGKAKGLSFYDIKLANLMYNCSSKSLNLVIISQSASMVFI